MTRRDQSDRDDPFRWDDAVIAAILLGVIFASHMGWIQ